MYFLIAIVIILFNVVGFYHAAHKFFGSSLFAKIYDSALAWILGCTIGIVGTLIGAIYYKIEKSNFKKGVKNDKDNEHLAEYGAKVDELGEKIEHSPNVQKIADAILKEVDKEHLPEAITVKSDRVYWFVDNETRKGTYELTFQDLAIAPIPSEHEGTLAQALSNVPVIKEYWEFNDELNYTYRLCLKREHRLNGLNRW